MTLLGVALWAAEQAANEGGGLPSWVIPLFAAIFGGGGIAGALTVWNERRRVSSEEKKAAAETNAISTESSYVPGEKLIGLAERAADIVSTKYEAVMNRQDEIIQSQQNQLAKQDGEILNLKIQVEKLRNELKVARRWQDELIWHQERVYQLEALLRSNAVEVPEPIFNRPFDRRDEVDEED